MQNNCFPSLALRAHVFPRLIVFRSRVITRLVRTNIFMFFCFFIFRDNILVLDIFFEALNYETIEQKKAYEVAGLLGRF